MQHCLDAWPNPAGVSRQTVEHPLGSLKAWMGATHFLTKSLQRVNAEMSLHVLAYNLKRINGYGFCCCKKIGNQHAESPLSPTLFAHRWEKN
jgi:hypothetical protein